MSEVEVFERRQLRGDRRDSHAVFVIACGAKTPEEARTLASDLIAAAKVAEWRNRQ